MSRVDNGHLEQATISLVVPKEFCFLPIPRRVRYDHDHPPSFGLGMTTVLALAGAFFAANINYCQPILIQMAYDFHVTQHAVATIPTLVQAGYAVGLLFISPLGDLVRRRQLTLILAFLSATLTIGLAVTSNLVAFEVLTFFVGLFCVVPQVILPLVVDLAPPERRALSLSMVFGGITLGVLWARVLSGIIAQFISWRYVYYLAFGMQYAMFVLLYWVLPDYPAKNKGETYFGILYSMAKYTVTEPALMQAMLITIPSSAAAQAYWVTLTFLLGGPPYNYSTLVIGLFGLDGIFGLLVAPLVGRSIDALVPWYGTLVGVVALTGVFALQTAAAGLSVAVVIIIGLAINLFRQTVTVSLGSIVLGLEPNARARLNAIILLSLFAGMVMGTSVSSQVFTEHGWHAAGALNMGWQGFMLLVLLARGPHVRRYTWLGWEDGAKPVWSRKVGKGEEGVAGKGEEIAVEVVGEKGEVVGEKGEVVEKIEGWVGEADASTVQGVVEQGLKTSTDALAQSEEKRAIV